MLSEQPEKSIPRRKHLHFRRLREHGSAIVVVTVALAIYITMQSVKVFGEELSAIIEHTLLTLIVVLLVHLLDHMYLSKDVLRNIRKEFSPLSEMAQRSLDGLAAASASLAAMRDCGMTHVYSSRHQASTDIAMDLASPDVKRIRLIGISLNDFILDNSTPMNDAYQVIERRLREIASSKGASSKGASSKGASSKGSSSKGASELDVKVLLLDPYTYTAQQRHLAETREIHSPPGRLVHDVVTVATSLLRLKTTLKQLANADSVNIDCRLYRSGPQMFLAWTDRSCYVEQYYYWSTRDAQSAVPLQRFQTLDVPTQDGELFRRSRRKDIHAEMERHFDWIWDKASISVEEFVQGHCVGYDMSMCQAGAVNVYMNQKQSADRIISLFKQVNEKSQVDLMGISLRSFFDSRQQISQVFRDKVLQQTGCRVRILCIDPNEDQAKYRSFREALLTDSTLSYSNYLNNKQLHKESTLCRDTEATIRKIGEMAKVTTEVVEEAGTSVQGMEQRRISCSLEAWQYNCAPSCFMVRVDDVVLFEPYLYGKLDQSAPSPTLSGDMPVFEFNRKSPDIGIYDTVPNRNPWGLLKDHFEFVAGISDSITDRGTKGT